jgi:hypothetical protein
VVSRNFILNDIHYIQAQQLNVEHAWAGEKSGSQSPHSLRRDEDFVT